MLNTVSWKNGNYMVSLNLDNGTKVRANDLDNLTPEYPECLDVKITNQCDMCCPQCHEDSRPEGAHGDIMNAKFIDSLHPWTELAIGGGNPLDHPDLVPFLEKCKEKKLIPNMTVHQHHFMENLELLREFRDKQLIYGLGVSVNKVYPELISALQEFPNAVVHLICGYTPIQTFRSLAHKQLKILILGYKRVRRGMELFKQTPDVIVDTKDRLWELLPTIQKDGWFKTVSFDNLAIEQLYPQRLMDKEAWDLAYMGDDAQYTYFVDLVKNEFAPSSTSAKRFPLMDDCREMLKIVREEGV